MRPWLALALLLAACEGRAPFPAVPGPDAARALIAQGPGSNVAVTSPTEADATLRPFHLPGDTTAAAAAIRAAAEGLPRWAVVGGTGRVVWATRTTRIFRFRDDVLALLTPAGDSTLVELRSASRLGRSDLGQNRRNLLELVQQLGAARP